jgi:short-subunit dehydrogenase
MDLHNQRILLTGAGGGIGSLLSQQLAARGARLCRLVRSVSPGDSAASLTMEQGGQVLTLACDITRSNQREHTLQTLQQAWGGVDILINLAGVLDFKPYQDMDPAMLHRMIEVNVEAPMQLVNAVLPGMLERGHGRIVNVGSMFGSIGFPFFAAYSATKFALRGFSQALRRELAGTGVGVTYVSPRAVNTQLNPPIVHQMAAKGMMNMDEPGPVADAIIKAIENESSEAYIGFPESVFARINAVLPGLVDKALAKQTPELLEHAVAQQAD